MEDKGACSISANRAGTRLLSREYGIEIRQNGNALQAPPHLDLNPGTSATKAIKHLVFQKNPFLSDTRSSPSAVASPGRSSPSDGWHRVLGRSRRESTRGRGRGSASADQRQNANLVHDETRRPCSWARKIRTSRPASSRAVSCRFIELARAGGTSTRNESPMEWTYRSSDSTANNSPASRSARASSVPPKIAVVASPGS